MRNALAAAAVLLVTSVVVASSDGGGPPQLLSATGLYVADAVGVVAPQNRPFSPQYPLWTDGASKSRWVYLPPGAKIDASDAFDWQLPVGTKFWKEFQFAGRKVETRMIWRASATRWVFATYVWNADGGDATLAPDQGLRAVADVGAGKQHNIPSATDCTACHGTTRPGPLGFNALQLSPDRDPNAIHGEELRADMLTLQTLLAERRIDNAPAEWHNRAPRIATASSQTRTVLGYLAANCGSCHNGRGEIAALAPILRPEELLRDGDAVARAMVDQRTKWQLPGRVDGTVLVAAAHPEQSALLARLRSRSPSSQMPPLGTVLRDSKAVQLVSDWISADLSPDARRSHR